MENTQYYKNQLNKTLLYAGISFVVFTSIFSGMMSESGASIMPGVLAGIFYSGVPSGWAITRKVFGGWIVTGYIGIVLFVFRLMLAVIIGVFSLPIQIVYYAVKIRSAKDVEYSAVENR